jgi:hypothetical protein
LEASVAAAEDLAAAALEEVGNMSARGSQLILSSRAN